MQLPSGCYSVALSRSRSRRVSLRGVALSCVKAVLELSDQRPKTQDDNCKRGRNFQDVTGPSPQVLRTRHPRQQPDPEKHRERGNVATVTIIPAAKAADRASPAAMTP